MTLLKGASGLELGLESVLFDNFIQGVVATDVLSANKGVGNRPLTSPGVEVVLDIGAVVCAYRALAIL